MFQPALYANKNPNSIPTMASPNRILAQFAVLIESIMFVLGTNIKKATIDMAKAQA
jgi:hypothetical protein